MPEAARITSVEAIEAFRADLLVYLEKARLVVEEVGEEVTRTRAWLQDDRGPHWAQQIRRRTILLQERQQELFTARLGQQNIQSQLVAVRRAQQALEEAEGKVKTIKQWLRDYPIEVEPLARHADLLRHTLVSDMGKALVLLTHSIAALHAYAAMQAPAAAAPPAPAPETPPAA
jgi:capsule polysaccharide export protein KpsE/RkpR